MKNRLALLLFLVAAATFFVSRQPASGEKIDAAQDLRLPKLIPQFTRAAATAISPTIGSLKGDEQLSEKKNAREIRFGSENIVARPTTERHDADQTIASLLPDPMPTPSGSFDGLTNLNNGQIFDVFYLPSDTNGDVGPDHYFQTVNTLSRIYSKNGTPLTPPIKLSDIFAPLNTGCAARNDGQAVVLYDSLADRWLVSQYCIAFPPFRQMIAVSRTGDPLGSYFLYEFVMPNVRLNDYAKFGVWPDGYYMSTDEFVGSDYAGAGLFAFDRAKILRGDPTAGYVYFNIPSASVTRLGGLLPADLDGLNAPPPNSPNIFAGYSATEYGSPQDAIRLFEFRANFADPFSSTFTERAESPLAVAAFDPTSPEGRADIAQPAPGDFLDSVSDRLMYRVAYRNFGTHEALVFNQTVRTSPIGSVYRAGVRVYEVRRTNGTFSVFDQTTLGDNDISRWVGSAAQDHQGNVAFQYSTSSELKRPSIQYSGRLVTEPTGSFRQESGLITGTGVQTAFGFRWGNFSGMTVDVTDDCTFWLTNQYFSEASQAESPFSWLTRIGSFKFSECTPAPRGRIAGSVTNASNGQPVDGAAVTANQTFSRRTGSTGSYGNLLLPPGSYSLTASAPGFLSQTVTISVADGQTVTNNFPLQPIPVLESAGATLTAESCSVNNAPEPNETVTMNIALRNTGLRATSSLTATLISVGGVINPSAPQNYGALPIGGATVSRPFTFTVAPSVACGTAISLTFELSDGAENIGQSVVRIDSGTKRIAFQENFDSVAAPALPAGWTTSTTGGQQLWTASTARTQTAPNSIFSPAPIQVGVNEAVSPAFPVVTATAEILFRNWYELETTFLRNRLYDGSVFEVKIGANDWQDIETAGGLFLTGGYDGVIDSCCQNPLGGRRGWSGRSGINQTSEFITSRAKLPASAAGQNVQLRWRVGTDIGTFRTGQFIDSLVVNDGSVCSCPNSQPNRAPFDFDGDGKTELGVFRPSNTADVPDFIVERSSDSASVGAVWGNVGDRPVNSDFDGDGKTDFAVFRPSQRVWYVLKSSDSAVAIVNFGVSSDVPTPADFDGDGRSDIAVFRPTEGVWYILQSTNAQVRIQQFGLNGDLAAHADYDGDAKADIAVYRPSEGIWYAFRSSDAQVTIVRFGSNGDKPVAGDFDGDGRADFAVYRPSEGNWYLLRTTSGFGVVRFGIDTDLPLQADFDGDGKRDIAVFRPSTNVWYHLRSSDGNFAARLFGDTADTALPSIFVP